MSKKYVLIFVGILTISNTILSISENKLSASNLIKEAEKHAEQRIPGEGYGLFNSINLDFRKSKMLTQEDIQKEIQKRTNKQLNNDFIDLLCAYPVIIAETFAHELGHYGTFNFFFPGSATKIVINPSNPFAGQTFVSLITKNYYDKIKLAACFAAGPLSGLAFNTFSFFGLNFWKQYKKEKNMQTAFAKFKKKPFNMHYHPIMKSILFHGIHQSIYNLIPNTALTNDGSQLLKYLDVPESKLLKIGQYSNTYIDIITCAIIFYGFIRVLAFTLNSGQLAMNSLLETTQQMKNPEEYTDYQEVD
ncbi:MAG: hypothetical protein WDZ41_04040 [Candidatus Babeliales bacterium]